MDIYSVQEPQLVGPQIKNYISNLNPPIQPKYTISDNISHFFSSFYVKYIKDNKAIIFIVLIFIIFLVFRYYTKKKKVLPKDVKSNISSSKETNSTFIPQYSFDDYPNILES